MSTLAAIGAALLCLGGALGFMCCRMAARADAETARFFEGMGGPPFCNMGSLCDWPNCRADCPWLKSRAGSVVSEADGGQALPSPPGGTLQRMPLLAFGLCSAISVASCTTAGTSEVVPEPRMMTQGQIQPICLAFCQIHQNLSSSEGVRAGKANDIAENFQGGTSTATQSREGN